MIASKIGFFAFRVHFEGHLKIKIFSTFILSFFIQNFMILMFYILGIGQNVNINPSSSWAKLNVVYVLKKQSKKLVFAPKIALRVECSDPAQNPYIPATFWVPASGVVSFPAAVLRLQWFIGGRGESPDQKRTQTISLNCGMTHSRGKIEYNCPYFLMTFRKRICKNKFSKNDFHTQQGTMSHRPLTNT